MFVYPPNHMGSPVEALWSEKLRAELAGLVCRTLRQALGAAHLPFLFRCPCSPLHVIGLISYNYYCVLSSCINHSDVF